MTTSHNVHFADSRNLSMLEDASVDLVVTSPPYPMIEMWDSCFAGMNPDIRKSLKNEDGRGAFELMHGELDLVWAEVARVLKQGGVACINIGDATRKIGKEFGLYPNHARISSASFNLGLDALPVILWRKQTNAPNKFMGSGMLPAGAYVTLEHEYILIFRKDGKRIFEDRQKKHNRRRSAFFWEERNIWYSDVWDFKGTRQAVSTAGTRGRSGAYPPELAYRLICMYSVYEDTVLDPFLGTGTTMMAAAAAGRNSIGLERDPGFEPMIDEVMGSAALYSSEKTQDRLRAHQDFVAEYTSRKGEPKHVNAWYEFPVVTSQEKDLELLKADEITRVAGGQYEARHKRAK
jgi:modification methylase